MNCLQKELGKLKKELIKQNEILQSLKKHPKILRIQELDAIFLFFLQTYIFFFFLGGN